MSQLRTSHGIRTIVSVRPRNRRQLLIEVAGHQFGAAGYDGVSMAAIAALAGVSVQAIYNIFGSKDGLWSAALPGRPKNG